MSRSLAPSGLLEVRARPSHLTPLAPGSGPGHVEDTSVPSPISILPQKVREAKLQPRWETPDSFPASLHTLTRPPWSFWVR